MSHNKGFARRSASHGALNSSYDDHGRMDADNSLSLPPFRPLKSLRENTAFLQSPGPLESMLKTTTETGDIGIFSIRPMKSSSTLPHEPKPRPSLRDIRSVSRCSRASSRTTGQDDRRRLPSYRDSTSEILSMYGGSNRSVSSSLYPGFDHSGQRSYSMVSSASRYLPLSQAERTARGHPHPNGLQRPRSPFPYPTRLKRPGVRPASPALTENGSIDYSRMVEIDRVSLRTIHGSYKPFPRQKPRRPLPLALRVDLNQSTPSLHSNTGHHRRGSPPAVGPRLRFPNYFQSHGDPLLRGTPDNSTSYNQRLPSLTSTIDSYTSAPLPSVGRPSNSKKAFYYDYSEEFEGQEGKVPPSITPEAPLAPVPTRISSNHRPMVLRDDYEARLDDPKDGSPGEPEGYFRNRALSESSEDASLHEQDESPGLAQKLSMPHQIQECSSGVSNKLDLPHDLNDAAMHGNVPIISIASPRTSGIDLQGILNNDIGEETKARTNTKNGFIAGSSPTVYSEAAGDRVLNSTDPRQSNLRGFANSSESPSQAGEAFDSRAIAGFGRLGHSKTGHRRGYVKGFTSKPLRHHHKRDHAAPKAIKTHDLDQTSENSGSATVRPGSPMIAPEPISPARLLRVENSIPQLMKALPPLPGYSPAPESPFGAAVVPVNFEPFELSRLTEARSTLTDAILPENRTAGNTNNYHAFVFDQMVAKNEKRPKLRLSPSSAIGPLQEIEPNASQESGPTPRYKGRRQLLTSDDHADRRTPIKAKLKLKISRGALSMKSVDETGTVKRHAKAGKSEALSEIGSSRPTDLFTSASGLTNLYRRQVDEPKGGSNRAKRGSSNDQLMSAGTSPPRLPPIVFDNHRGSSLDAYIDHTRLSLLPNDYLSFSEIRSVLSEGSNSRSRQRLKRGLSNFRAKFAETHTHNAEEQGLRDSEKQGVMSHHAPVATLAPVVSTEMETELHGSANTANQEDKHFIKTRKLKKKLEKWLKEARHAVVVAMKKGSRRGR